MTIFYYFCTLDGFCAIKMAPIKDKTESGPLTLNLRGKLMELKRPLVMGIINVTPDSFYAESRHLDPFDVSAQAIQMEYQGADIIDVGGCSTRPDSSPVDKEEELARLRMALEATSNIRTGCNKGNVVYSVDTFRSEVAEECLSRYGVHIINDISGGIDPRMFETVARHNAGYVLTHNRGLCAKSEESEEYGSDIMADVVSELAFKVSEAREAGVCNLIVDPGLGFGKTEEQSLEILSRLECLKVLGCPILVGLSRKRMVRMFASNLSDQTLTATTAMNAVAVMNGADIIRVHDVMEGSTAARVAHALKVRQQ